MFRLFVILTLAAFSTVGGAQDELNVKIPNPLFEKEDAGLAELRSWSLDKWQAVRKTNHPLYTYALETTRFRAYLQFCKRHELNVDMSVLNEMALGNLSEIIAAHYEETEWVKLQGKSEAEIRAYIADVGQDLYAFEYATALADLRSAKEKSGNTTKAYCTGIAQEYQNGYIALRATAKRKLGR